MSHHRLRGILAAGLVLAGFGSVRAAPPPAAMAPVGAYLMADRAAEIALARSAAPPAIGDNAQALVLTPTGYVEGAPGKNGFVCVVSRAWFSGVADEAFWNPRLRGPICFNPQAARSVLPTSLERTTWALGGLTQSEIAARTRSGLASGRIPAPATGSMTYMLSKGGYLGDGPHGPWHPHIMFYMAPMATADWGADQPGSPVMSSEAGVDPYTMFYIVVANWSDGTPDEHPPGHHSM